MNWVSLSQSYSLFFHKKKGCLLECREGSQTKQVKYKAL